MGFVPFTFVDFIDIILVAVIMYWIYRMTKGTNAPYILSGIIAIYLLWVVVRALNMELLSTILGQLISVGAIALIIVFQPELRRFLRDRRAFLLQMRHGAARGDQRGCPGGGSAVRGTGAGSSIRA